MIVVAPCGYRLEGAVELAHEVRRAAWVPDGAEVWVVDAGAQFVRPGPRLVDDVETLAVILHPEVFELPARSAQLVAS